MGKDDKPNADEQAIATKDVAVIDQGGKVIANARDGQVMTVKQAAQLQALDAVKGSEFEPVMRAVISGELDEDREDDPEIAWARIITQIFRADTVDDVLASIDATGLTALLDKPIKVLDIDFQRSDYEVGSPYYLVMKCINIATGENMMVTCGAKRIIAQAVKLKVMGALPVDIIARKSQRATKNGFFPLRLEKA